LSTNANLGRKSWIYVIAATIAAGHDGRMTLKVAMVLFPRLTQLDLTGPYEIFTRVPEAEVHLVAHDLAPVASDRGLAIVPTTTFETCPAVDVVCVPGGPGQADVMDDERLLGFLRQTAGTARYMTSVCTGSLLLGAAGLLRGRRATTHWSALDQLRLFGAEPVARRYVIDGSLVTGGGVTAGIDFGLALVMEACGEAIARGIALGLEYRPSPPFAGGHPDAEDPAITDAVRALFGAYWDGRREASERAAARLARVA
jgi:cyclohexyl-isocyanide hydratase